MTSTSSLLSTAGFGSNRRVPRTLDLAGLESAATVAKWQGRGQLAWAAATGPIVDMCPKRHGSLHPRPGRVPPTACLGVFFETLGAVRRSAKCCCSIPAVFPGRRRVVDTARRNPFLGEHLCER